MTARASEALKNSPRSTLLIAVLVLAGLIMGANYITLSSLRGSVLHSVRSNLNSMDIVLAQEVQRSFKVLDLSLSSVSDRIARLGITDPAALAREMSGNETYRWLREKISGMAHVEAISIISAGGKVVNYSRGWPVPPIDVVDRDYFQAMRADATLEAFVSRPVINRGNGAWSIFLARRLNSPDGEFMGLVLGVISLPYFDGYFKSIALSSGSAISLVRDDGSLLAGYAFDDTGGSAFRPATENENRGGPIWNDAQERRIVAKRRLPDYAISIEVSQAETSALASWRQLSNLSSAMAAACALMVGLVAMLAKRFMTQQRELALKIQRQNDHLDAALANMSTGLCMFDPNDRLVICNDKFAALYQLPEELRQSQTPRHDILRHLEAQGICKEGYASASIACRPLDVPGTARSADHATSNDIHELADGRQIAVVTQRMPDGGWVATHEDVTEERRFEAKIVHMAHHDALTGLANRVLLRERLEHALAYSARGTLSVAVFVLDLDRFKEVNDTLGHGVGDALLKSVAQRLKSCTRGGTTVARIGGDEFAIIEHVSDAGKEATALAMRLLKAVSAPYELGEHRVIVGTSIGIAVSPADGHDPEQLLKSADLALYRSKSDGRNRYCFFEPEMNARLQSRRTMEQDLRRAIANGEFELNYQPFFDLASDTISGFEALVRWHRPGYGLVSPAEFIPVAEETGLIVAIGEWVVRTACEEATKWPEGLRIAVNLSPLQFKNRGLLAMIADALSASGLANERLEVEITETALLQSDAATLKVVHELRQSGVKIAMDDFGTGYSSLAYLKNFPFDRIKIDRSFVRDLANDSRSVSILRAITALARNLGVMTIAEGVETEEQLAIIRAEGCSDVQGYLFSRPVPASRIPDLLVDRLRKIADAA
jgi:diguanylate cyclase (GGDEF)-like protein